MNLLSHEYRIPHTRTLKHHIIILCLAGKKVLLVFRFLMKSKCCVWIVYVVSSVYLSVLFICLNCLFQVKFLSVWYEKKMKNVFSHERVMSCHVMHGLIFDACVSSKKISEFIVKSLLFLLTKNKIYKNFNQRLLEYCLISFYAKLKHTLLQFATIYSFFYTEAKDKVRCRNPGFCRIQDLSMNSIRFGDFIISKHNVTSQLLSL